MIEDDSIFVRALFRPLSIPGSGLGLFKIFYPAQKDNSEMENNLGLFPANKKYSPYPVVLLLNGVNCNPNGYQWLAEGLTRQGYLVVSFHLVSQILPEVDGLSPGMDFRALTPDVVGTRPSCPTISATIDLLHDLNQSGPLQNLIDTDTLFLGGHSGGGSMALLNANPKWFPQVKGVFTYAAHSGASVMLGYPKGTVLPLSDDIPMLLMGGTQDGVISYSTRRYGSENPDPALMIRRTFQEALPVSSSSPSSYFVLLKGANHFSIVDQIDTTTARSFLDQPEQADPTELRKLLIKLILYFLTGIRQSDSVALHTFLQRQHPLIEESLLSRTNASVRKQ